MRFHSYGVRWKLPGPDIQCYRQGLASGAGSRHGVGGADIGIGGAAHKHRGHARFRIGGFGIESGVPLLITQP